MLEETVVSHLIRSEDLNHHGTLFAGRMALWLLETCLITTSRLTGKPKDVVCINLHGMNFKRPAYNGDVLVMRSKIAFLGTSSITVHCQTFANQDKTPLVSGMATFVTVDRKGKPYAHGLKLPEDYIASNREIYNEALKTRGAK